MLTTSTIVKQHLGITGTAYDSVLGALVTHVDKLLEEKTGVYCNSAVKTVTNEICNSNGTKRIRVKYKPITELTAIEYKDYDEEWQTYDDETVSEIDFDDEGNEIFLEYVPIGKGRRNLRVSYKAGYVSGTNVPKDLELCATLIVSALFNSRGNEGVKSASMEGVSMTFEDIIEKNSIIKNIISRYSDIYAV